jgi:(Z)-2-((N-methylformamido)methylene)-5-hydroxybutyrolactone dehydrogenase
VTVTNDKWRRFDTTKHYQMHINGEWVEASSGERFESIDPFTGRAWATIPEATIALDGPWGRLTGLERGKLLRRLAEEIDAHAEELALIETIDNGKIIREMLGQLKNVPEWYYYFAGGADKIQGDTIPSHRPNYFIYTVREPVGVVAGIVPWNSPLLITSYKLAPALAAGCTFVLKPAEQASASALEFAKLFDLAGFPPGVFNVVTGHGSTGSALVKNPGVSKIAFTGSNETGRLVSRDAAEHLAPVTLELGGKSPNIVFADADLDAAANGVIAGIFAAAGQTCVAGSRLLVHADVREALIERVVRRARSIVMGDPLDADTELGPIVSQEQLDRVMSYVAIGEAEGATLACGGRAPLEEGLRDGFFITPTVFTDVDNRMRVAREEIFGPVLTALTFESEEEALALANDTPYGLAAGVWTSNLQRGLRMSQAIKAGNIWLNTYRNISFNVPFGGYKASGVGRENGLEALHDFTQVKSVWVELSGATQDPFRLG